LSCGCSATLQKSKSKRVSSEKKETFKNDRNIFLKRMIFVYTKFETKLFYFRDKNHCLKYCESISTGRSFTEYKFDSCGAYVLSGLSFRRKKMTDKTFEKFLNYVEKYNLYVLEKNNKTFRAERVPLCFIR
jgi:CTP:phosphocholine cytidylyltransferase-like protein